MRKLLSLLAFSMMAILPAAAATYTVNSSQSQATIQGVINGTSIGDTVLFSAGTYSITAQLTLKCGVTYTGPAASPSTAVLNGSGSGVGAGNGLFTLYSNSNLSNPCTQATTIQYINFQAVQTGIYVETSFTNLTIQHIQCTSIPGLTSQTSCIVFESGTTTSNTASILTNTTIINNQFGDANSCVSPVNVMNDTHSPEDYEGACNGMVFFTSINGLTVEFNQFNHVAEGAHINCPNYAHQTYPCEPPGGAITYNLTVRYNDFNNIHRITWEEQPQQASGVDFEFNSEHDWVTPYFGAFGLSMACCYNGTAPPALNGSNNVVLFNTNGHYGYAMEAMGHLSLYNNNLAQANATGNSSGLAYGCGPVQSMSNNTVQGGFNPYIFNESGDSFPCGTDTTPAQLTGNVTGATVSTITSVAPGISPSAGSYSSPLTVTLTDPGYTSGPQPLGNTSIYYTTDGSTPNPGAVAAPVGCAGVGNVCTPVSQPAATLLASTYGFSTSASVSTNDAALASCNSAANAAGTSCSMVAGNFATGAFTWTGPAGLYGAGAGTTILSGAADTNCQITLAGSGMTFAGWTHICPQTVRDSTHWNVFIGRTVSSFRMDSMELRGGDAGGFINFFSNHGIFSNNYVHDTLADCLYTTDGSSNMLIANNKMRNCGDDSISNVSYMGDTDGIVSNIVDRNNDVGYQSNGRGITVVGGQNITIQGNLVANTTQNACIYLADEPSFNSRPVSNIVVQNNTLNTCSGSTGQAALLAYAGQGTVSNILVQGNAINNAVHDAMGTQSLGGITSNVAFINNAIVSPAGSAITNSNSGAATGNVYCAGNTLGGAPVAGGACGGSNSFSPTGANLGGNTTQLYTLPFAVTLPATVKAVGMWGQPNQPASYATGYGFTPSAVQTVIYTASGGIGLSSVSIAATAGQTTLLLGNTVQMIVTCHYSDGSTTGCNTTDSRGNSVTSWNSSGAAVTVSNSGLATGAGIGSATITATVTGGLTTSPGATLTVSANPTTLSSVSLATSGAVTSIMAGATNQILATCHYSDGSSAGCDSPDSHGDAVNSATSSAPSVATITSPGALATGVAAGSTNLSATVIPAPGQLGTSLQNVTGFTNNGYINEIYAVTGTAAGGYTPGNCHIILPATTWAAGKLWTCLLVLGTPTTQNGAALCSNSYTTTGTSWAGGDLIISMASCPTLPPDQGYWVGSTTNQAAANPVQGFSNCNSSCSGAAPLFGSGAYAYRYVANTFGAYTALPTTLNASGGTLQVSQYVELTTTPVASANLPLSVTIPAPSLVSAYLTASSGLMIVGNTLQMAAKCHYTSGPDQDCTVADIYGDAVSAWLSSDPSKATVNNVGASNPGLVTAVAAGTPSITAKIGSVTSSAYPITVSNPVVTLTGVSISLTGGITVLFVGSTNQLKATCTYSDGSSDDCTATDAHGTIAHNYVSTSPAHATVNATSGMVTGVALGTTTFTAVAGSFTSNALPLNVFPVLSGIYTITISGPVKFSGTVRF